MGRLEGQVALVTGAARGQGRSHVVRLAEEGADIIAMDLRTPADDEGFAETVELVEATGRRIVTGAADVRRQVEIEEVTRRGVDAFGRLDIVVANAGVVFPQPTLTADPDLFQLELDVNVRGVFNTVRAALPAVLEGERGGSIILVGSTMSVKASRAVAGYAASKHAVLGLLKVFTLEFAAEMVRFNAVLPTTVNTPMLDTITPGGLEDEKSRDFYTNSVNALPIPWVEPIDVSNAIVWLSSAEARYVTGAALPIDAGALLVSGSRR